MKIILSTKLVVEILTSKECIQNVQKRIVMNSSIPRLNYHFDGHLRMMLIYEDCEQQDSL